LNPVNPLEDCWDPEKVHSFPEPWNSLINTVKLYLLTALVGPSGLLLVVSHLLAVPVSVLWVGLEKS